MKWRTGCEGRISTLKRGYGWDRTMIDTTEGARILDRTRSPDRQPHQDQRPGRLTTPKHPGAPPSPGRPNTQIDASSAGGRLSQGEVTRTARNDISASHVRRNRASALPDIYRRVSSVTSYLASAASSLNSFDPSGPLR